MNPWQQALEEIAECAYSKLGVRRPPVKTPLGEHPEFEKLRRMFK